MKRKTIRPVYSGGWLTTFGDLLTLLLCFFICIVSLSPLTETTTDQTASNKEEPVPGITLAPLKERGAEKEFLFNEGQYQKLVQPTSRGLKELVQGEIDFDNHYIKAAFVETCFSAVEMYEGEGWFQSIERSLALRRQLIDAGIRQEQIAVRSVGPWCETLKENQNQREFVSRVVVTMGQVVHG